MRIKITTVSAKVYQRSRPLRVYGGAEVDCDDEAAERLISRGHARRLDAGSPEHRDPGAGDVEHRDPDAPAKRKRGRPPKDKSGE